MNIILDAMGGDNAPLEILKRAADAVREDPDVELTLVGQVKTIRDLCAAENIPL